MTYRDDNDEQEKQSFLRRFRVPLAVGILVAAGVAIVGFKLSSNQHPAPHKAPEITMVKLAPLPPPPPPPPPQVQPEQKMIEQAPIDEQEEKPDDKPQPPAAPLTTNVAGNGPADGFGLGASRGNLLGGSGMSNKSRSPFGWYASQVQTQIADALRKNRRTRNGGFRTEVRVWPDLTGRITRAQLIGTTGDPVIDGALKNEILTGFQLQSPPPAGMPAPITMRLTVRRPN